jgi:hypothetical protein
MTVRTKHIRNPKFPPGENDKKIAELGSGLMDKEVTRDDDNNIVVIRSWPSMESAQAWCDYITTLEGVISAEILED